MTAPEWTPELMRQARFKIAGRGGQFHWELINPYGTPIARSAHTFLTEGAARRSATEARAAIAHAPVL